MELICEQCGKTFQPKNPSKHNQRFCSRKCFNESQRTSVVRECKHCGKEFLVQPCQLKIKGGGTYCSRECQYADKRKSIVLVCEMCGGEFEAKPSRLNYGGKYCSRRCANEAMSVLRSRQVEVVCKHCGKTFTVAPNRLADGRGVYCSKECMVKDKDATVIKPCEFCGEDFESFGWEHRRFCSRECSVRGVHPTHYVGGGAREDIGDQWFRSTWEANYARLLNHLKDRYLILGWEFEPGYFDLDDEKYLPDFKVVSLNGLVSYHEVKGYMDETSERKLGKMARLYPDVPFVLVDSGVYSSLEDCYSGIVPNWEVV